jgi:hypothetical protein
VFYNIHICRSHIVVPPLVHIRHACSIPLILSTKFEIVYAIKAASAAVAHESISALLGTRWRLTYNRTFALLIHHRFWNIALVLYSMLAPSSMLSCA